MRGNAKQNGKQLNELVRSDFGFSENRFERSFRDFRMIRNDGGNHFGWSPSLNHDVASLLAHYLKTLLFEGAD